MVTEKEFFDTLPARIAETLELSRSALTEEERLHHWRRHINALEFQMGRVNTISDSFPLLTEAP